MMKHKKMSAVVGLVLAVSCSGKVQVDSESSKEEGQLSCDREFPFLPVGAGWHTNPSQCPNTAPEYPGPCAVPEGMVCAYLGEDERRVSPSRGVLSPRYTECGCFSDGAEGLRWHCFREISQPAAEKYYDCPAEPPVHGASCEGFDLMQTCPIVPDQRCLCKHGERADGTLGPVWGCEGDFDSFPTAPELPESIDETRAVDELSAEERTAWCQWFQQVPWETDRPDVSVPVGEVSTGGMMSYSACAFGFDFVCNGTLPRLTQAHCEQNLALSNCGAPLSELSDCVRTMVRACKPAPRGCAPYLERPGCYGTIIAPPKCERPDLCSIRVE